MYRAYVVSPSGLNLRMAPRHSKGLTQDRVILHCFRDATSTDSIKKMDDVSASNVDR